MSEPRGVAPRIVMCGCTDYGLHLIERLLRSGVEFAQFVVLSPEQGERGKVSGYCDLAPLAKQHGISVYVPKSYSLRDAEDIAFFQREKFDLLIQGGWQRLFPDEVLASLRVGAIGVHGSADFLPRGRGRSPLNWSLIEDKKRFLLQLFLMKAGADDGDVFAWDDFDITPFDTIETLYFKNVMVTHRLIARELPKLLTGTVAIQPQHGEPTYYAKRTEDDGAIDWQTMDVHQVYNLVRAVTRPYPGAFAEIDGALRRIWRAQPFDTRITYPDAAYGEVVERFGDKLIVNCLGGLLLIDDHEPTDRSRS